MLEAKGDNDCKIPHTGKDRLENEGLLPVSVEVMEAAFDACSQLGFAEEPPNADNTENEEAEAENEAEAEEENITEV